MNDRKAGFLRPATIGEVAISTAVVVTGLLFARYVLSTVFYPYDDEGFFLIALEHYLKFGHLYSETYSQYGPAYFYAQEAIYRLLQLPVTHDSGRLITLAYLMASGLLGGAFIYRLSRNMLLASAAAFACIRLESKIADEPGHPQQLVLLLLMLSCFLSASAGSGRKRLSLFLMGAVGAALVFTKINVGVFYLAALAQTLFCLIPPSRLRTAGLSCLLAYSVAAPILLMYSRLFELAGSYCLVAVFCGASTFAWSSLLRAEPALSIRRALMAVIGAASVGALIVVFTMLQGMSLNTLLHGVILDPAKLPNTFAVLAPVGAAKLLVLALILCLVNGIGLFRGQLADSPKQIGALRCAVGLITICLLVHWPSVYLVLPFLPLGVIPISGPTWSVSDLFPRLFIASLAVTQFLQAYPVMGTQLSIASAPMLLWGFICIVDGIEEIHGLTESSSKTLWKNALTGLIILVTFAGMFPSGAFSSPYPQSKLKGSAFLHLPPVTEQRIAFLADSIRANCDALFTMPGMGSYNFWSGVPALNGWNATNWMRLFSSDRQREILDLLESNHGACVLYNQELLNFWQMSQEELVKLPLATYILYNMPTVAHQGGYEIRINPKRTSPWIQTPERSP